MTGTPLHLIGLGCARNDTDAEELAARLAGAGFTLVADPAEAEVIVVNTCGFIEAAKRDSVNELLAAADYKAEGRAKAVVATGCLAQRYGAELAEALPEADAVIGFDGYADIGARVRALLDPPRPAPAPVALPLPTRAPRLRLTDSPMAPLKIATGCNRRCAFCAIPAIRGPLASRPAADIVAEAEWLAGQGVKEAYLVSEDTTAYGRDRGDPAALPGLLRGLAAVDGLAWIRLSYLQPAELRPDLIAAVAQTPKVVPYFDLPFQHAAGPLLRRMRRFGDADTFLGLLDRVRAAVPEAGIRTNVIVGFPGETEADIVTLTEFLDAGGFDAIGVFGYSDEEGTEAATLDGHLDSAEIDARVAAVAAVADHLMDDRARRWLGRPADVLVLGEEDGAWRGRVPQQGPDDGETLVTADRPLAAGDLVRVRVEDTTGVDLIAVQTDPGCDKLGPHP